MVLHELHRWLRYTYINTAELLRWLEKLHLLLKIEDRLVKIRASRAQYVPILVDRGRWIVIHGPDSLVETRGLLSLEWGAVGNFGIVVYLCIY